MLAFICFHQRSSVGHWHREDHPVDRHSHSCYSIVDRLSAIHLTILKTSSSNHVTAFH
ncbi:AGAP000866-PA [Anopheles gambiae str. PEST]|uniref:AGAP000866-PA n=1 Tax=Anopheles gambiae TaxID=7165 RepID=A0NEZ3_ANOGA|nr:AGAP000866-PA [Anopheles gambiae str. PEST]